MGHIELARWPDLILVAPASADFLARATRGHADDLLTTLLLASKAPIAVAPAMNQGMWLNQATQDNLATLTQRGYTVLGPAAGSQACGDVGPGRMLEPVDLATACAELFDTGILSGLHLTITAGPTREAIDPVRFISNHSSGKMAYALATEAIQLGARVTLISGPVTLAPPERAQVVNVVSARQMLDASLAAATETDVFIGVAAVADYRVAKQQPHKIKKNADTLQLELVRNPDIISTIAALETRPFMVGFAAETQQLLEHGEDKLKRKKLDLLFANDATATFNSDSIAATALWPADDGTNQHSLGPGNKHLIARHMLALIKERLDATTKAGTAV